MQGGQLYNENGQLFPCQEFQRKYDSKTCFPTFYQVINAIPKALITNSARNQDKPLKNCFGNPNAKIHLAENII